MKSESVSCSVVCLFATPWTVARQAPPSMGFSRQEYWSGLPFLSPGNLPDLRIQPRSPAVQMDSLLSEPPVRSKELDLGRTQFVSPSYCIFIIALHLIVSSLHLLPFDSSCFSLFAYLLSPMLHECCIRRGISGFVYHSNSLA